MTADMAVATVSGREPVSLGGRIRALVAQGTLPEDLFRVRRDLGAGAAPDVVVTALEQRAARRSSHIEPDAAAAADAPIGATGAWPHGEGAGDGLLAWGEGMPLPVSESWVHGGPLWLHHRGSPLTDRPHVAVVGTRIPTLDGTDLAGALGHDLAQAGVVVVSGMARGIDQAAHRGALQAGGATVGVLGTGFDIDYPARTDALREAVAASGGLVSEYPASRGIRHPSQFINRNRILVALSLAVVVIEAGARSGALNSATWAADFGREVLVIPSSPSNAAAAGSLALLRDGATPVRGAAHVIEVLGVATAETVPGPGSPADGSGRVADSGSGRLSAAAARILPLLGPVPATPSALAAETDLSPRAVLVALSQMEAEGFVRRTPTGVVRWRPRG